MNETTLLAIACGVVLFACVSDRARAGRFTAPMMFAGLGLLLGPLALGLVRIDLDDGSVERLAELTLVTAVFTNAVRIDLLQLRRHHSLPFRLLCIGLPLTMAAGTLAALWLFPAFTLWEALLLAVILGPTDAALGEPVVTSATVPPLVRQGLNVESGLNDGLGLPCLLIAASLASGAAGGTLEPGEVGLYLARQILGGPVIGAVLALLAVRALERPLHRGWVGEDFFRLSLVALPVIAYLVADKAGANGFLAAFASGVVISTRSERTRDEVEAFNGALEQLLNASVFFLVGALLLPQFLHDIGWPHLLFAILALTVLRMGPVALACIGLGIDGRTMRFLGWFGPRGMASVIYLLIVITDVPAAASGDIAATVALTVAASIVVHGLTAAPGSHRYGACMDSMREEDPARSGDRLPGERRTAVQRQGRNRRRSRGDGDGDGV